MGWVGLRVSKLGKSSKILKRQGWFTTGGAAELNNRNGFNWIRPGKTNAQFNEIDWRELANAGLVAVAIWFCDAQWKFNAGITDAQWQNRAIVEADFNSNWPTGRRA